MIEAIHPQLSIWGRRVIKSESSGFGYASTCPMFAGARSGDVYRSSPPVGIFTGRDSMDGITEAVKTLEPADRARCYEYYVVGGSHVSIATRLRIPPKSLYNWLQRLHEAVQNRLCDGGKGDK